MEERSYNRSYIKQHALTEKLKEISKKHYKVWEQDFSTHKWNYVGVESYDSSLQLDNNQSRRYEEFIPAITQIKDAAKDGLKSAVKVTVEKLITFILYFIATYILLRLLPK